MNRYRFCLPAKVYLTRTVDVIAETEQEARDMLRDGDYEQLGHDDYQEGEDFADDANLLDVEEYEE